MSRLRKFFPKQYVDVNKPHDKFYSLCDTPPVVSSRAEIEDGEILTDPVEEVVEGGEFFPQPLGAPVSPVPSTPPEASRTSSRASSPRPSSRSSSGSSALRSRSRSRSPSEEQVVPEVRGDHNYASSAGAAAPPQDAPPDAPAGGFLDCLAAALYGPSTRSRGPVADVPLPDKPLEYQKPRGPDA